MKIKVLLICVVICWLILILCGATWEAFERAFEGSNRVAQEHVYRHLSEYAKEHGKVLSSLEQMQIEPWDKNLTYYSDTFGQADKIILAKRIFTGDVVVTFGDGEKARISRDSTYIYHILDNQKLPPHGYVYSIYRILAYFMTSLICSVVCLLVIYRKTNREVQKKQDN